MLGKKLWRVGIELGSNLTIVSNDVVHLPGRSIAVLLAINQESRSADTRHTTECTETRGTTADHDDIVIGLGHFHSAGTCQEGDKSGRKCCLDEDHGEGYTRLLRYVA